MPGAISHVGAGREIEAGGPGSLVGGQRNGGIEAADTDWKHDVLYFRLKAD